MTAAKKKEAFRPARVRVRMTPADMVREAREANEMTQAELATATDIAQPTISSIEAGRIELGVARAKRLALALHVHPSVLLFPQWDEDVKEHEEAKRKRRSA
ncbi:MAG: helix-turn-helix domain-containing protein [Polyangiaceae bacterium]